MGKAKYVRASTLTSKLDRQLIDKDNYDFVFFEKISGIVPFNQRPKGEMVMKGVKNGKITALHFHDMSRVGRNVKDTLDIFQFLKDNNCIIVLEKEGLSWHPDGNNDIFDLTSTILSAVYDLERRNTLERTEEGRRISRVKHPERWVGRKSGTCESKDKFLKKHNDIVKLIKKGGYSMQQIKVLTGKGIMTVYKVRDSLKK